MTRPSQVDLTKLSFVLLTLFTLSFVIGTDARNIGSSSDETNTPNLSGSSHRKQCGLSTLSPDEISKKTLENTRYVGDNEVPFVVSLQFVYFSSMHCTAAIIESQWLLVDKLGLIDMIPKGFYLPKNGKVLKPLRIFSRNDTKSEGYDLAQTSLVLVQLKDKLEFGPDVQRVCLPEPGEDESLYGKTGIVVGDRHVIKKNESVEYLGDPMLWKLSIGSVPVMRHDKCQQKACSRRKNLTDSFLCAGTKEADEIVGGSLGNLLMVNNDGFWTLIGMGASQDDLTDLGAYHRIGDYVKWIHRVIYENNYQDSYVVTPNANMRFITEDLYKQPPSEEPDYFDGTFGPKESLTELYKMLVLPRHSGNSKPICPDLT